MTNVKKALPIIFAVGVGYASSAYFHHTSSLDNKPVEVSTTKIQAQPVKIIESNDGASANAERLPNPTETFPKFIEATLDGYGFDMVNLTEQQWSEFISLSAIDYFSERLSPEVVFYIAMTLNDQELIIKLISQGVDIDKRVKMQNFQYPLRFAAVNSNIELFSQLVDASQNINANIYSSLIRMISRSNQEVSVQREKIDYLISAGYELTDTYNHIIPLVTFGGANNNPYIAEQLSNLDPNQKEKGGLVLSNLIAAGARDDVVMTMINKLDRNLDEDDASSLIFAALRSSDITQGNTITALLNTGIDPNLMGPATVPFAATAFLQAVSAKNEKSFDQAIEKLDAVVAAGGKLTNDRVTIELVNQAIDNFKKSNEETYPNKYRILEAYIK
ncbi:hypothetical protein [Vibrio pelagius]|uniref:hypothetical protein n=1 Tax=Vibrio pelagius TaxID=28169 RepID=UPI0021C25E7F|nr:hypothetical protein [Vibrio pelagius]